SECPKISFHLEGHPESIFDGADLVVISPGVPFNIPILESLRKKGVEVIGEIELAYRFCRSPIIAITGTKGKSTTSTLAGQILSKTYKKGKVIVAGNIGIPLSQYVLDLKESDLLVLEVSSFQLETTVYFKPFVSVILNVMTDHLDRHKDFDEYISAKYKIFANQTEEDYIILNADDPNANAAEKMTKAKSILFSSRRNLEKGIYLENDYIVANLNGDKKIPVCKIGELKIIGIHNVENSMAATAISLIYGAELESIADVLREFKGLEHALEFVAEINGIRFINDSKATNVISLKAALESIDTGINLIIGGRDKGNDYEPIIPLVKEKVRHLIIIGESADKIENSLGHFTKSIRATTIDDAVNKAYNFAKSGETVLLSTACASFDMFRDYADRGNKFKEAVKRLVIASDK
ncbi:MAG: UDP-N-acetylmuramoyl-L-alanine--D-glutamate ligase, partial [Candidatus Poribacteria bacterium]